MRSGLGVGQLCPCCQQAFKAPLDAKLEPIGGTRLAALLSVVQIGRKYTIICDDVWGGEGVRTGDILDCVSLQSRHLAITTS